AGVAALGHDVHGVERLGERPTLGGVDDAVLREAVPFPDDQSILVLVRVPFADDLAPVGERVAHLGPLVLRAAREQRQGDDRLSHGGSAHLGGGIVTPLQRARSERILDEPCRFGYACWRGPAGGGSSRCWPTARRRTSSAPSTATWCTPRRAPAAPRTRATPPWRSRPTRAARRTTAACSTRMASRPVRTSLTSSP